MGFKNLCYDRLMELSIPLHLAFIVDGNRRWARERGLPTLEGHKKGLSLLEEVAMECFNRGVKYVSFYVFSTENWGRAEEEVSYLMRLVILNVKRLVKRCLENNVKIAVLGSREKVSDEVLVALDMAEDKTKNCSGGVLGVCFNYGGRKEIVEAVNKISGEITEEKISAALYHPEIPDCDMIVRTSGEQRLSGFMLWRAAYAELLFLEQYWPELSASTVGEILEEFAQRNRRFGK